MSALVQRWRQLPLRARLAALVALAVAAAVVVVSLSAWLLIRNALLTRVDADLAARARVVGQLDVRTILAATPYLGDSNPTVVQGLTPDGRVFVSEAVGNSLPVRPQDLSVARGQSDEAIHNVRSEGQTYRVLTVPSRGGLITALQWGRPLDGVYDTLGRLALLLTVVGVVGVAASAALGLVVARTGLRPVDRLTSAAERVARTQDLSESIEVSGPADDEVARLASSFNGMLAALADARRSQRQLVEDASHELRTPLTSLRTNIELLLRAEDSGRALPEDERRQLLLDVRGQMVELSTLTTELVSLARDEAMPEEVAHLDLTAVVRQALDRARARRPGLTVDARLDQAYVVGRTHALERAVLNLLDNAAKWSPEDGVVELQLDRPADLPGQVRIIVADRGPGIDPADLPRVFERFYRASAARAMPGSGLGLAIVRQAVEADGGTVRVAGRAGGGTLFEVRLPLAGAQSPADAIGSGAAAPQSR